MVAIKGENFLSMADFVERIPRVRKWLSNVGCEHFSNLPYQDREDAIQEVFVNIYRNVGDSQFGVQEKGFFGYCRTAFINMCSKVAIRRSRLEGRTKSLDEIGDFDMALSDGTFESRRPSKYEAALERLPDALCRLRIAHPSYSDAIELRSFQDLSLPESAAVLGVNYKLAGIRYSRGLGFLRKILT